MDDGCRVDESQSRIISIHESLIESCNEDRAAGGHQISFTLPIVMYRYR
jgi:hypothetical protein